MKMIESLLDHNPKSSERWPREYYLKNPNNISLWILYPSFDEAFIEVVAKAVTACKFSQLLSLRNSREIRLFRRGL